MSQTSPSGQKQSFNRSVFRTAFDTDLQRGLTAGELAVIPTDTLYGLAAHADNEEAVERVYTVKQRDTSKAVITLIHDIEDLTIFGVIPTDYQRRHCERVWPGRTTIVFPTMLKGQYKYLHRGTNKLAFRIPADETLREFVRDVGPIIAPSANPEGQPPATHIDHAYDFFGDAIEHYVDGGERAAPASDIIDLSNDSITVVRGNAADHL